MGARTHSYSSTDGGLAGEVLDARLEGENSSVRDSLTADLCTIGIELYNPSWKRQHYKKWKQFDMEVSELQEPEPKVADGVAE